MGLAKPPEPNHYVISDLQVYIYIYYPESHLTKSLIEISNLNFLLGINEKKYFCKKKNFFR